LFYKPIQVLLVVEIENLESLLLLETSISLFGTPCNFEPDSVVDSLEEELEVSSNVVLLVELKHFFVVPFGESSVYRQHQLDSRSLQRLERNQLQYCVEIRKSIIIICFSSKQEY
jgi:hypothetical protein